MSKWRKLFKVHPAADLIKFKQTVDKRLHVFAYVLVAS